MVTVEGHNGLDIMKAIYGKSKVNIILSSERLKAFPLRS